MKETGLKDRNGAMIHEGNIVTLDGNMTTDNSMGVLYIVSYCYFFFRALAN